MFVDFGTNLLTAYVTDTIPLIGAVSLASMGGRLQHWRPIAGLLIYVAVDDAMSLVPLLLGWNPGRWNWIGQSASLALSIVVMRVFLSASEVGFVIPRGRAKIAWSVASIVIAVVIASVDAMLTAPSHLDAETFAYEATLPGPVEEIVLRGIGLALLARGFARGPADARALGIGAVATTLWFTAGHVVHLDGDHFVFVWRRLLDVLPMGALLAWVRIRSGSLLGGVLAHNTANIVSETIGALRA